MKSLYKELRSAGASEAEARELAVLAHKVSGLKSGAEVKPKKHFAKLGMALKPLSFGATVLASLAIGMLLVMYAQTALPGSVWYPIQELSDATTVRLRPQYRANVMMKRAQQLKQLVAAHAGQHTVLAALADYQAAAGAYKSMRHNYAAFEYCASNLRQAANMAPPSERAAITKTLNKLPSDKA